MRMSNYLVVDRVLMTVMSTETPPRVGIDHPTVVPTNFVADPGEESADDVALPI